MEDSQQRAMRIAASKKLKGAMAAMRAASRALGAYESLDGADIVGVVQIAHEEREADYAADLLDMVRSAAEGAGSSRAIEVVVTTVATSQSPQGTDEGDGDGTSGVQRDAAGEGARGSSHHAR